MRPRRRLLEELREIEWELSTTPTLEIKNRENELIDRAKFISSQIEEHRKLDTQDDMYLMSLADSKAVGIEIGIASELQRGCHAGWNSPGCQRAGGMNT